MNVLLPPAIRYLSGRRPSHSSTVKLHTNFKNLQENTLKYVFMKQGYLNEKGKPTKKSLDDGLADLCERNILWNLSEVETKLKVLGLPVERQSVNQELKEPTGEPQWANLGTIATYFNVTAKTIGKWLDELGLRDDDKMGTKQAFDSGMCITAEMKTGDKKNSTRKICMWNLYLTQVALLEAGHELDFDYDKSLKGTGKNSDVTVSSLETKVAENTQKFMTLFKDKSSRHKCKNFVSGLSRNMLIKMEEKLGKKGFLTSGEYLKFL